MGRPARGYKLRLLPSGDWQVRFTYRGERYEISTEEQDLDRAEAKAAQLYAAVISGRWAPGTKLAAPGARVSDIGREWIEAISPLVAPSTSLQYGYYVTAHWQPHFVELDAFARPTSVPNYIRTRLKQVIRRTLQKELSAMRSFLAWCKEVGHLAELVIIPPLKVKSPGTRDQRRRHKSVPIELSVADVRAILEALPEWSTGGPTGKPFAVRDFFTTVYETGLRPDATVAELVPEDLRAGELAVRDEVDKARFGRSVPLTPLARECLERHATTPGKPIFGRRHRATYLKAAALLAGKPGVSAYDFRHARATHLMEASGNNILGVGYLLGHTQATTTNRYAKQTHRAAMTVLKESENEDRRGMGAGDRGRHHGSDEGPGPMGLPVAQVDSSHQGGRPRERSEGVREHRHPGDAPRRAGVRSGGSGVHGGDSGDETRLSVLGTTGNGGVRKEGVEPSREVIPQEPEDCPPEVTRAFLRLGRADDTTENGGERQGAAAKRVRLREDCMCGHSAALHFKCWGGMCSVCQGWCKDGYRPASEFRVLPAIGLTQAEVDEDLAPRKAVSR